MDQKDKRTVIKAIIKVVLVTVFSAVLLFGIAGTLRWAGPWIIVGFTLLYLILIMTVGLKYFPQTVLGRAESKFTHPWDKLAVILYSISTLAQYSIAGFDHKYSWSTLPDIALFIGIIFYGLGIAITFWVLSENPFAIGSSRIQDDRGQKVIMSGPYRFIRHPMYATTFLIALSTPLILSSLWAFIPAPLIIGSYMYRCFKEDTMLQNQLTGYKEYALKVKYRIIPFIW